MAGSLPGVCGTSPHRIVQQTIASVCTATWKVEEKNSSDARVAQRITPSIPRQTQDPASGRLRRAPGAPRRKPSELCPRSSSDRACDDDVGPPPRRTALRVDRHAANTIATLQVMQVSPRRRQPSRHGLQLARGHRTRAHRRGVVHELWQLRARDSQTPPFCTNPSARRRGATCGWRDELAGSAWGSKPLFCSGDGRGTDRGGKGHGSGDGGLKRRRTQRDGKMGGLSRQLRGGLAV